MFHHLSGVTLSTVDLVGVSHVYLVYEVEPGTDVCCTFAVLPHRYVNAMADLIMKEMAKFSASEGVELFFSAHGVPKSYVEEAGDPYKEEMEECVGLIMEELRKRGVDNHFTLAYQSRVGPVEWLKPYTDESIR